MLPAKPISWNISKEINLNYFLQKRENQALNWSEQGHLLVCSQIDVANEAHWRKANISEWEFNYIPEAFKINKIIN